MKCPKPGCGWTTKTNGKFCQECGSQMVPSSTGLVVICGGNLEDGSPCHAEIVANQKFCSYCGKLVDQQLFKCQTETCTECGSVLELGCKFCDECGLKKERKQIIEPSVTSRRDCALQQRNPSENYAVVMDEPGKEPPVGSMGDHGVVGSMEDHGAIGSMRDHGLASVIDSSGADATPNCHKLPIIKDNSENLDESNTGTEVVTEVSAQNSSKDNLNLDDQKQDENITVEFSKKVNIDEKAIDTSDVKSKSNNDERSKSSDGTIEKDADQLQLEVDESVDSDCDSDITDDFQSIDSKEDQIENQTYGKTTNKRQKKQKKNKKKRKKEREEREMEELKRESNKQREVEESKIVDQESKVDANVNDDKSVVSTSSTLPAEDGSRKLEQSLSDVQMSGQTKLPLEENGNYLDNLADDKDIHDNNLKFVFGQAKPTNDNQEKAESGEINIHVPPQVSSIFIVDKTNKCSSETENHKKTSLEGSSETNLPASTSEETERDSVAAPEDDIDTESDEVKSETSENNKLTKRQRKNLKRRETREKNKEKKIAELEKGKKEKQNETSKTNPSAVAKKGNQTQHGATSTEGNTKVRVTFHVLVSPDFNIKEKDKVIIRTEDAYLGGWESKNNVLHTVKEKDGYVEMKIDLMVESYKLRTGYFAYKYAVISENEKFSWENYHNKNKHVGTNDNRVLNVPFSSKKRETWHQYDGVLIPKPQDNIFKRGIDWVRGKYEKNCEKYAETFVETFCPEWFKPNLGDIQLVGTVQESVDQLQCLLYGIQSVYFRDAGCWDDETAFKRKIGGCILYPVIENIQKDNSGQHDLKIIRALSVVIACKNIKITLPEKELGALCKSLLVRADEENQTCPDMDLILQYYPKKYSKAVLEGLVYIVEQVGNCFKNPSWLFCMPLIHFLSERCQPYQTIKKDITHADKIPVWWGTSEVNAAIQDFKKGEKWAMSLDDVLHVLQPLFKMDLYLPRTIMAALKLDELKEVIDRHIIPIEVCCATVLFYIRKTKYSWNVYNNESRILGECLASISAQLHVYFVPQEVTQSMLNSFWMAYKIAAEIVQEYNNTNRLGIITGSHVFLHVASIYDRVYQQLIDEEREGTKTRQQQDHLTSTSHIVTDVVKWMKVYCCYWSTNMESNLTNWNSVFVEELQSEQIKDLWNAPVVKALSGTLENDVCKYSYQMQNLIQMYCEKIHTYTDPMQKCLNKVAFSKAMEKGYNINYSSLPDSGRKKFGELLSRMYQLEWDRVTKNGQSVTDEAVLKMTITWSPFEQFLSHFYASVEMEILKDECKENLVIAVSIIGKFQDSLMDGSIEIGHLTYIQKHSEKFSELVHQTNGKKAEIKALIKECITIRASEVEAFKSLALKMTIFRNLCTYLPTVNEVKAMDAVLDKQDKLDKYSVREFCRPYDVTSLETPQNPQPDITAFQVPGGVFNMLSELQKCQASSVFMKMWTGQCDKYGGQCSTLDDVLRNIWTPVKKSWCQIASKIESGTILFREMEQLIGRTYRDDYDSMLTELKTLQVKAVAAKECIKQLQQYRQLEDCMNGAKVILQFAEQYELTGNFEQIRTIAMHHNKELQMREFNNSLMKTCDFLKDITKDRAECLNSFVSCGPLVNWLQESMEKSGLKELKVFVDLAFMSAGDEPINIARVQCLHSAVTGYAPLIFDLKQSSGYKKLLETCSIVWKELEANPGLPKKLIDTNRQLQWFQEIEKAHGSVEVTSLVQAEAINSNGIFSVGRNAINANTDGNLDMSSMLRLTVPEDKEGKRQLRNYTFSQLQDLQSRLMLVAGKAENDNVGVERFTMIFDSVKRLSGVYLKLYSAGCVLFKDWTARFLCDTRRPVCAILEFGQGDDVPSMKGRRSKTEELQDVIPRLAKFMETCLEEWLDHIRDKRRNYLHLNYFTIDQLVILQRELVKLGTREEPSHCIYPLLSAVKHDCTPDDLLDAMTAAKAELERDVDMEEPDDDTDDMGDAATGEVQEETEDMKRQTFIHEMETAGYDTNVATKALEHVSPEEIDDGIIWCMSHCDDEDEMEDEESDQVNHAVIGQRTSGHDVERPRPTFTGWSQSEMSIQSVITSNISGLTGAQRDVGVEPLIGNLTTLWKEFLGSITSNIQDYLSLEHLGMILKYLASQNRSHVNRNLPPGLEEGSPNLIVCASGDVLSTALSLYMLEKDQPLPQSDEVLMCTTNTTIDEVDIFWRRAIFDGGEKIHCLVNADLLDFEVSEAAEKCLEQYMQEINYQDFTYRLVVLCGSDNEYRSRIVASLDKHRRPALPVNTHHLREYLATKLKINKQIEGVKHAACVDFNRSSVRLIKSWRSGVGKTLYKNRREADLARLNQGRTRPDNVSVPLQEKHIDLHSVISRLLEHTERPGQSVPRIFHLDVAHEVQFGVDYLLFNLLVLGCLMDKTGYVWRKSPSDLYLIETMPLMIQTTNQRNEELQYVHQMLSLLPDLTCRSPQESLNIYTGRGPPDYKENDQLFDAGQFQSTTFQRPFQYLSRLDRSQSLDNINPRNVEGSQQLCLQSLLRHCGMQDPSWAELHHFVWFLNTQLCDFEQNSFVGMAAAEDLPGFSKFVLRFLIQMSRDFSTRSLNMSEESPGVKYEPTERMEEEEGGEEDDGGELERYQMRRTWESSPHPYLFFNSDKFTFTFLGFNIDRRTGNLIDQQTRQVLDTGIMAQNLYDSLVRNHAPMQENFDALPRHEKILKLCKVMGIDMPHDPDDSYELTTDNVKKILAIYMRFRCDIPVIIMGETGCGKTRLIKFMCALQTPPGVDVKNMILMKVHGGTTNADIIRKVREAEKVAHKNVQQYGQNMFTVLFFDEANTTESIGLIKEIMCDKSMEGTKLTLCENLKMVAACNPYRKHSDELIKKLEQAGLGYHVDADETTDKLGRVPMRRLVYRVQPLPQSLLPLVWDFGQLNYQVEDLYIRQMVKRYIRGDNLPNFVGLVEVVSAILTASQNYMREQKDECSFVSLRDVDRVLSVMSWFYIQSQGDRTLYDEMDDKLNVDGESSEESEPEDEDEIEDEEYIGRKGHQELDDITRSLVLALGVCYHACLKTRPEYRDRISKFFQQPCQLPGGADQIEREIMCCQDVFLDNVQLEKNIARNMALKENLFMMVVCIELRIPLFLVGKPGSSKSLAKTIVSDAMQGNAAREELFKELKQAQMVSFQCSPLSTPDGIMGTFRQCAQFQKDKALKSFVSVVVLDEVGLAEDSPRMPLKTLHPLLEDGCQGDEEPKEYMKVAFIGISNWALDPAKMNRGILVQREVPDQEELQNSARGICYSKEDQLLSHMAPLIKPMAESYLETFEKASSNMREFFGLRDFYSLVKMIYSFVEKSHRAPTWHQMLHAIKRNFGGLDKVDPVDSFRKFMATKVHLEENPRDGDPDCTAAGLIQACLFDTNDTQSESRYLLLLTENYGALTILEQQILDRHTDIRPIIIFGSSFRSDQEYTQVCRNINKIKVCMETGNTVVLLNLENLYESLYDALNQYYVYFGGERYVDLGLGTHRVKCPVHKDFRLIVVAEKQTVYKKFPIPLINRLEKHFLTINTMLSQEQQEVVETLEDWAKQFSEVKQNHHVYRRDKKPSNKVGDVFMGYHDDTCSAIVLHVWGKIATANENLDQVVHEAKVTLLWCATPDAVTRLEKSNLPHKDQQELIRIYNQDQKHDSIVQYLQYKINHERCEQLFAQVTTHSKLLAGYHKKEVSKATGIALDSIMLLDTLSSFDTEQQFSNKIQQHLQRADESPSLLMIQCDSGDINANLVACARYCVMDEYQNVYEKLRAPVHIVFIVQLPRIAGGCFTGFQCGKWHSVHIDDLWSNDVDMPSILDMQNKSVAKLIGDAVETQTVPMETDENMAENPVSNHDNENMDWEESGVNRSGAQMSTEASRLQQVPSAEEDPIQSTSAAGYQLENVIGEFESIGGKVGTFERDGRTGYHGKKLNVKNLILSCVQAALSMVKDKDENSVRTTERVSLILKLFHNKTDNGSQPFLEGVSLLIAFLLKEKEANTQSYGASNWLVEEAAKFENIHKAGTFKRSCIQTLESKISPILAGIIAYLDRNQNLSILQDDKLPWKQDLWLSILKTQGALNLKYSDLQSPARQSELNEAVVMTTGCEGHVFQSGLPFSWLIHDQITEILKAQELMEHDEEEELCQKIVRLLSETAIGKLFQRVQDYAIVEEVAQEYIDDFVHVMYHAHSDQEHALVIQSISYVTQQMVTKLEETSLLHMLVCVHMSYQSLAPRLAYFRTMNQVWPDCSLKIVELKQTRPDHFMFKEEEFTFSALCLLIENLTPVADQLNNPVGKSRWLNKVHQYRPVVEKVLRLHAEDPNIYGAHGHQSVHRARGLWSRVVAMKLFLEHVCAAGSKDKITIKHCMPLWKLLGEEANLKEVKSMNAVEAFLKSCNKTAMKEYMGKEEKCCNCEVVLDGPPIVLPCKDLVCDQCYHDLRALGDSICPKCRKSVSQNWNPARQEEKKKDTENLKEYQKCCNTFFMDVVSQLCFADNSPPSDEVINKLLGYITCMTRSGKGRQVTKALTIFDSGIDPNPVFRSFLLQLLMRTSEDKVKENLEKYLVQAQGLLTQGESNKKQYVELCQLIIQCLEDIFLQNTNKPDVDEVEYARKCLQHASYVIFNDDNETVETLYGLAESRVGLAITARYISETVLQEEGRPMVDRGVRKLIEAAQNLCLDGDLEWPRIFLVKYMCRCYGIDAYQAACKSQVAFLRWIRMPNMNRDEVVEGSDRYVVCGDRYATIRETLTKVILGEDIQHLAEQLQGMHTAGCHVDMLFQLALHREITCSNLYAEQQRNVSAEALDKLGNFINDSDIVKDKNLLQALVRNELGGNCRHLTVTEGVDLRHQGLQCLLVHFLCVMSQLQGERTLMQPLIMLVRTPQACANAFLPTMPQDDLADVKEALLAARRGGDENPVIYRCPNGHPYVIGDCGRPYVVAKCKCGADIGGQGHRLLPSNTQDAGLDATVTGHILGRAEVRGQGPITQRSLTPAYCAWVRLITHMSMYMGAARNIQGIHAIIKPDLMPEEVPEFLWRHMMMDITDLQRVLGKSVDDILLLGHSINNKILNAHRAAANVANEVCFLSTKNGRNAWEQQFSANYIQPILRDMDGTLKINNQLLLQDQRLGSDPLLCLLYETDTQEEREDPAMTQQVPAVWRYRTPISIDHLRQEFEAQSAGAQRGRKQYQVLKQFLKEEHYLRAIRYIPSILRLHRALFHKYQRKLDKAEASTITVGQLKKEEILGAETVVVIQDFVDAWELVREELRLYLCPTEAGGMIVAKDFCNTRIQDKTPISMLLPTTKEFGLCSFALLDFLMRKQNDFLDKYLKMSGRKADSVSTIPAREVTSAHLISYDPQNDILPLVLANCQYSFEIGKGTKIEYDFTSLERQLMDRFLFSKSRIDVGRVLQIDLMVYRSEFTNAAVFKKLADKIPQESLSLAVKSQICSEIRFLPDLCLSLDNLDITISFLKSIDGDKQHSLNEFMINTLKMESSLQSQKARQVCEFQHTQSLWMVLSFQKSKQMAEHSQPRESIFESVIEEFHEDLPEETEDILNTYMRNLSIDKLTQLLEVLHEYILLKVAVRENPDDEDYTEMRDNKMTDWLYGYIEGGDQFTQELLPILADFPEDILHKHSVHTWIIMYAMLREKQTGNRRR